MTIPDPADRRDGTAAGGAARAADSTRALQQIGTPTLDRLPRTPHPFVMRDWKEIARRYDAYVFDRDATGPFLPLIWDDRTHVTSDENTFGIYSVPGAPRQGPLVAPAYHEAVNCMAAVIGASLVGIDKRRQHGYDYVRMCEAYFSPRERGGPDIFGNVPSVSAWTRSMWYFIFPNMLAACLGHFYPGHGRLDEYLQRAADRFLEVVDGLADGTWYTGYDFDRHEGTRNGRWTEGDAPAGVAWLLYMAGARFGSERYIDGAIRAMDTLVGYTQSPFYEVLLPFGVVLAARMNAELGTDYDVTQLLEWCCDGSSACRPGWGVITDRWGSYDVAGLQGSRTDGGGYAFAMNSFELAAALAPLPRYDPRYALTVGRLLLNAASSARLMYADGLPPDHQTCYHQRDFARDLIAYEGVRRVGLRPEDADRIPCACGDALGGRWGGGPYVSDFSLYGSSHVGMLAGVIDRTQDERVIRIDCLATDYFHRDTYPTYLYVNSSDTPVEIWIDGGTSPVDLHDLVAGEMVGEGVVGSVSVGLPAAGVRLLQTRPARGH